MSHLSKRVAMRALVLMLASVFALAVVGAANAEFPTKRSDPSVRGTPQEGQTLDGSSPASGWMRQRPELHRLQDELHLAALQRGSRVVAPTFRGATGFSYRSAPTDVGKRIRFVEWIFKRDCGAHNNSTGQHECQDIDKNGASALDAADPAEADVTTATSRAADRAGPRRWRMRSFARPAARGPARARSRRRSSGSAATPPAKAARRSSGATGPTYRLTAADVGTRIRVVETATNEGGTAQAVSAADRGRRRADADGEPARRLPRTKVTLPHRLLLERGGREAVGRRRSRSAVKVSDDRGFRVTGSRFASRRPACSRARPRLEDDGANGWATFIYRATGSGHDVRVRRGAPRRARRPRAAISTSNLFKVRVR